MPGQWRKVRGGIITPIKYLAANVSSNYSLTWHQKQTKSSDTAIYSRPQTEHLAVYVLIHLCSEIKNQSSKFKSLWLRAKTIMQFSEYIFSATRRPACTSTGHFPVSFSSSGLFLHLRQTDDLLHRLTSLHSHTH